MQFFLQDPVLINYYLNHLKIRPNIKISVLNSLLQLLFKQTLMFNFFIYNVPKNIKKFTRNKSGKYLIV
jgi:hypothetical protein